MSGFLGALRRAIGGGQEPDRPCSVCGHPRQAHAHYRRGSDCALCDCPRFRGPWPRWLPGSH